MLLAALACLGCCRSMASEDCPTTEDEIQTDRPDVTNSSVVVPVASLQLENGIDLTRQSGSTTVNGTNSRLRLGVGRCLEVLLDLPDLTRSLRGNGPSGLADLTPAVKRQFGPLPGDFEFSATLGLGLPTGARALSGRGFQPYLQLPWSRPIVDGWELTGMLTEFWSPRSAGNPRTSESTFSLEHEIGPRADWFAEFVGDYPSIGAARQYLNFGGGYRVTHTQQIDFHTGFGLDDRAPRVFFGIGYSWRWDDL